METETKKYQGYYDEALKRIAELEKRKVFEPKYGISVGTSGTIDRSLTPEGFIDTNFYFILGKRFFISPELRFKFYDEPGGGIGINFGFLF